HCALCHGAVRFLLAEDRDERFTFSPIGGERFTRTLREDAITNLPDSMILVTDEGNMLLKSDAVIACLHGLGGLWRCCALVLALLPRFFRDRVYDLIGSRRYKLFGTKAETCPLMTGVQRRRFHA
ncbi:MAG: thiol-disulfide oxidoreductase DCC family protein, partial [Geminicoccaceae bacterium]